MNRVLTALIAVVMLVFFNGTVMAQQGAKIGSVDLQKILSDSEPGKKAKTSLETFIKSHQAKIDEKEKAIEKLKDEIEKKGTALSEDAKKKKQDELQSMMRDLKRMASDAQEDIRKKEGELTKDVFKDIKDVIAAVGKEEGYAAIMDNNVLLYSSEGVDVTDKVIKKYNDLGKKK
ncbi:MAG: OmpH family outer membrane protein [Candidatus Magnetobacterium sp. LHC-1]|uniref:OmpH family outer membrane protein n=1 Tax=Candidatus Magnetobacterium casense TaxID=1455061 RepID=A0ABS6RW96_9BACT|nr:OmpH family outer membrane protein [Candidatus Magnetobacterium casensis]MBF0606120.1 OmpH family outer membrane protein [Nitrospirota bacterium]MBV6340068.1 OmpH family outer membrane protein [Candidatus Magnetobacterium casensis]